MSKYRTFDAYLIETLKDPKEAEAFLRVAIEEYDKDGDSEAFMLALRVIAESHGGIARLAAKSSLNRQNLYKILTGKTVPRLDTTLSIIRGLGFKFGVESISSPAV